jgi:hypothetical protein
VFSRAHSAEQPPAPEVEVEASAAGSAASPGAADASAPAVAGAVAWHAPRSRVLCIPGRGPLDALALVILLQLLGKHGFSARALPHEAVSRASIDTLDANDVGIVCILYVDLEGMPSHLRYLIRRIRARLPNVAVVVGLWKSEGAQQASAELPRDTQAECCATSLKEMLAACRRIDAARTALAQPEFEDG